MHKERLEKCAQNLTSHLKKSSKGLITQWLRAVIHALEVLCSNSSLSIACIKKGLKKRMMCNKIRKVHV